MFLEDMKVGVKRDRKGTLLEDDISDVGKENGRVLGMPFEKVLIVEKSSSVAVPEKLNDSLRKCAVAPVVDSKVLCQATVDADVWDERRECSAEQAPHRIRCGELPLQIKPKHRNLSNPP